MSNVQHIDRHDILWNIIVTVFLENERAACNTMQDTGMRSSEVEFPTVEGKKKNVLKMGCFGGQRAVPPPRNR